MSADDANEIVAALHGLRFWLDGGWGVDALLARETRDHSDLDVAIDERDLPEAERRLGDFRHDASVEPGLPARYVLRDARGRQVDFHVLAFDGNGDGWQSLPDGTRGRYPARDLDARGVIGGREVPCISAELQLRHHTGYEPTERDVADVRLLTQLIEARA